MFFKVGKGQPPGCETSGHTASLRGEGWGSAHLLPFIPSGIPIHGMMLPISKVDLHPDISLSGNIRGVKYQSHGDSDSHQVDIRD